jgi:hypothetical protein
VEKRSKTFSPVMSKKALPMSMVGFPLLLIPLAIYNIIVFLMPGVSLGETLVSVPLTSGAGWALTLSDVLVALGILMLLLEVIKGARPGAKYLTDHLLSLIVFAAALAEFLLWPRFANSTYFLLTLLALTDFLTSVALRVRRSPAVAGGPRSVRRAAPEVIDEPVDARAGIVPPAVESVGAAPSEPTFAHPQTSVAATAAEPDAEAKPASGESRPPEAAH